MAKPLIAFLYLLMRDHVPPGTLYGILENCNMREDGDKEYDLTNKHLEQMAEEIVRILEE